MTNEETQLVQAYIAQLQAQHAAAQQQAMTYAATVVQAAKQDREQHIAEAASLRAALQSEEHFRRLAQADCQKMSTAVLEIWKLANAQSTLTPAVMAQYTRQIVNYYCPDFDIPF